MNTRRIVACTGLAVMLMLTAGCGGPSIPTGTAASSDKFLGRWISSEVKGGGGSGKKYEFSFLKPNVFVATEFTDTSMRSLSGTFVYNPKECVLDMKGYVGGDVDFPDGQMRLLVNATPKIEIRLNYEDKPSRFDSLIGLWRCGEVMVNNKADKSATYDLRFIDGKKYKLIKSEKEGVPQIVKGVYEYDSNMCLITLRDESGAVQLTGTIVNIEGKMRIQTKTGMEYMFRKEQ